MKKKLFVLSLLIVLNNIIICQTINKLEFKQGVPDYIYISNVYVGSTIYYDEIVDENEGGFRYRVIKIMSGIYSAVYIDKIMVDVEGIEAKQEWSEKINLYPLYKKYLFSEETDHFEFNEWIDYNVFSFYISNYNFIVTISENPTQLNLKIITD